jgi:hypothetical protein
MPVRIHDVYDTRWPRDEKPENTAPHTVLTPQMDAKPLHDACDSHFIAIMTKIDCRLRSRNVMLFGSCANEV